MKRGFTLIELLIVVTIIAILAGAAIPYVQEYIEDARISRVKADLTEIKNALIRYEIDKGTSWPNTETNITKLVGPYLAKALIDPWGTPYQISESNSIVVSAGPDRAINSTTWTDPVNADNITVDFRPPLAMTKAYWIDADKSGTVTTLDQISLRFTRPLAAGATTESDFNFVINGTQQAAGDLTGTAVAGSRNLLVTVTPPSAFVPGRDSLICSGAAVKDQTVAPFGPNLPLGNQVTIQALQ